MGKMTNRVVIFDREDNLTPWWKLGSVIDNTRYSFGVGSWAKARDVISAVFDLEGVPLEVQSWGHGSRGRLYMGGQSMDIDFMAEFLEGMVDRWWGRACQSIAGEEGHDFAEEFVNKMGCDYIGHAVDTNRPNPLWQGRIAALRPGERAWWGLDGSGLRGVFTTRMKIPDFAYVNGSRDA